MITTTRGDAVMYHNLLGYEPVRGEAPHRAAGVMIGGEGGAVTAYSLDRLYDRGDFFVKPTDEVYEGMVVGENSRADDMDVNITKEKQLTNMRAASADNFVGLTPPKKLSLEECLEFAREDECVEVTPEATRIRKVELDPNVRARQASARKRASQS